MISVGDWLWTPPESFKSSSHLAGYMKWLADRGQVFNDYDALWRWSSTEIESFWESIWQYFDVHSSTPYRSVLTTREMPGCEWFPGARVNYARELLSRGNGDRIALHAYSERGHHQKLSWYELKCAVFTVATALRELGVRPGDRVAAYLPNVPEAAIAFLATISIGGVWSSCSPDFGVSTVIDRFGQIEPKLLLVTDGYYYGGKGFDRRDEVKRLLAALPSVRNVIHVPGLSASGGEPVVSNALPWRSLTERPVVTEADFRYEDTEFSHPLWIVYSSGTTGLPKPFVHGHGGALLEALKFAHFHLNLHADSCMFYFTTTGWVMWNILLSGLVTGSAVVLYDGNPGAPDPEMLWKVAQDCGVTFFGTSPTWVASQMKLGVEPAKSYDLRRIDSVLIAGAPAMPEHFEWFYRTVNPNVWVTSQSGGTDVATAFVGGCPLLPVYASEIQTRCLGVDVVSLDDDGEPVVDRTGELVVRKPMPSMPLYFWNDSDGRRYRDSYFDVYPGFWRHGDFLKINQRGGCYILGRSDSTLNRHGVRIGTAEIYRIVEAIDGVADSLVVNLELRDGAFFMPLFVALKPGLKLDTHLETKIRKALREQCSPRHVPDRIVAVDAIPYTLTGKKLEVPVKKILLGQPAQRVASRDAMSNPDALNFFVDFAREPLTATA